MALPSSFAEFRGNSVAADGLRAAIVARRFPHSLIVAGARGAGKYTLALMLTMALECERQPREQDADSRELAGYCGVCRNCTRIAEGADLNARVEEAVAAREDMRETDKKDTPVLVQTHPDVLIIPPDPPQLMIKLGQVRTLISRAQYMPVESPAKVFVITSAAFMKEAANSLLKVLEEPPGHAHLILLAENLGELLPTIRSRCAVVRLGALPLEEIEALLQERRPDLPERERALVARLSEGAAGRALEFNVEGYMAARGDALVLLRSVVHTGDHSSLFRITETYRAGAEGQTKTLALLRAMSSLLEDLLLLQGGAPDRMRNIDLRRDLDGIAEQISFDTLTAAVRSLDAVYAGMRRNLLRGLSLDAFAAELETAGAL